MTEIANEGSTTELNRRRRERRRRREKEGVALREAVSRGEWGPVKNIVNRHIAGLLRTERARSWAIASDQMELRDELAAMRDKRGAK